MGNLQTLVANHVLSEAIRAAVDHLGRMPPEWPERQSLGAHLDDLLSIQRFRAEVLIAPAHERPE